MRNKPFHTFLLPLFFILHVVNSYYGLISYKIIFYFFFVYLFAAFILFLMGNWLFKKITKAGCWATCLLVIFFFFGATHDFLKGLHLHSFLVSYTFLLTLIIILVLFLSYYIKISRGDFIGINKYLNLLFAVFVLFELSSITYKKINRLDRENNLAYLNKPVFDSASTYNAEKPDIFFIVFDEYASSRSLSKYLHYNNSGLDSFLQASNFHTAFFSKSNYNSTPFSIGSTFNLDYFNKPLYLEKTLTKLRLQAFSSMKNSQLQVFLAGKGYKILNFGLVDLPGNPVKFEEFSSEDKKLALYGETLWGRIDRDIWWHIAYLLPSKTWQTQASNTFERNLDNFKLTLGELAIQNDTPKFVFLHVMMPHRPFVVDSNGNRINLYNRPGIKYNDDSLYVNQLIYTNRWIEKLAKAANNPFKRSRVVIIEGDHGWRDLTIEPPAVYEKQFMNLNSYFFQIRITGCYMIVSVLSTHSE